MKTAITGRIWAFIIILELCAIVFLLEMGISNMMGFTYHGMDYLSYALEYYKTHMFMDIMMIVSIFGLSEVLFRIMRMILPEK